MGGVEVARRARGRGREAPDEGDLVYFRNGEATQTPKNQTTGGRCAGIGMAALRGDPDARRSRELIRRVIQLLSHEDWPVRWIDPETAHMTLHFLGATPPERAELLRLALAAPVAKIEQFTLKTGDFGVFPNPRQPRVLWIGLDGDIPQLERLHKEVGANLQRLGFEAETGKINPHITLGRVRDTAPASLATEIQKQLAPKSATARLTSNEIQVPINEMLLVRSFLDAKGAKHVPIASYPLAKVSVIGPVGAHGVHPFSAEHVSLIGTRLPATRANAVASLHFGDTGFQKLFHFRQRWQRVDRS